MNRFLPPLLLLCVCATAQAQSTVSLTGTTDAYVAHVNGSLTSRTLLSSGGNSTSKFRIRANEDLGDGWRAGLWLESGVLLDSGSGQPTNINNQPSGATTGGGMTFNRRSILYLGGPWGELRMGRDWSPTYDTYTPRFDPFGVGSGIAINYTGSINPSMVRVSNDVNYLTPRFFGLTANVHHWFGENPGGTATSRDGDGDGVRFNFDVGNLGAVAAFARTRFAAGDAYFRNVAVVYNFGSAQASIIINHDNQASTKQEGEMVGFWVPLGAHEIKGSYSQLRTDSVNGQKATKLALGYVYSFSKRTAFYATYADLHNKGGSALAIPGSTTAANESSNALDLGLRHNF